MTAGEHPIYFDNQATTAVDPRVVEAMRPTFDDAYGNPESAHPFGWRARSLVERARELTSRLIGAQTHEIEFTSGATESLQRAILGSLVGSANGPSLHIVTATTEHRATLAACADAERRGHSVTVLPTDHFGQITAGQVIAALRPNTALVTLMHGNNEIGTLHPLEEIGSRLFLERKDVLFHVDAAQTAGKHPIDVDRMNIDLLSFSAHKFHGPKGIGALFKRSRPGRRIRLDQLSHGTPNVSGIVGLGAACEIAHIEGHRETEAMCAKRDLILDSLESTFGQFGAVNGIYLNGARGPNRLCNNISLTIEGTEPDEMRQALKGIAYSSASACTGPSHSHVLRAIGQPVDDPFLTTLRFGLSRLTTDHEVAVLISRLIGAIQTTRTISNAYDPTTKRVPKS